MRVTDHLRGEFTGHRKWPVTRKIFPFDDVIKKYISQTQKEPMTELQQTTQNKTICIFVRYAVN